MNPTITTIILCLATCIASKAQSNMAVTSTNIVDTIKLTNGSFEARVARGKQKLNLKGWKDFGKIGLPESLSVSAWVIIPIFWVRIIFLSVCFEKKGL